MIARASLVVVFALVACNQGNKPSDKKLPPQGANASASNTATRTGTDTNQNPGGSAGTKAGAPSLLTPDDFKSENLRTLGKAEFTEKVNQETGFFSKAPKDAKDTEYEKSCLGKAQNDSLHVSGGVLTLSTDEDVTTCLQDEYKKNGVDVKVDKVRFRQQARMVCDGVDLAKYDGKKLFDVDDLDSVCNFTGKRVEQSMHMIMEFDIGGKKTTSKVAMMNADGSPCVNEPKDKRVTNDGCGLYTLSVGDDGEDYSLLLMKKLEWGKDDKYYRSGSFSFTYNEWKGEMKYSSADAAPKWTAKDSNNSASGTYSYQKPEDTGSALALTDDAAALPRVRLPLGRLQR